MKRLPVQVDGVAIYTLRAPGSKVVRYVGSTERPRRRLYGHISDARRNVRGAKNAWVRSLLAKGERPVMHIERVVPVERREDEERRMIGLCDRRRIFNVSEPRGTSEGRIVKVVGIRASPSDLRGRDRYIAKYGGTKTSAVMAIFHAGLVALGYRAAS